MSLQNQCQMCGDWGHNRRGCPVVKAAHAKVKAAGEEYGVENPNDASGSPYVTTGWINDLNTAIVKAIGKDDGPEAITYRERWLWEEREERLRAQAQRETHRSCGFCGVSGHNARTCEDKKQHLKDGNAMQSLAHRVVAACLEKAGIVPGALMQFRELQPGTYEPVQALGIVIGMDWDQIARVKYDDKQVMPNNFEQWFSKSFIKIQSPSGAIRTCVLPRNVPQQSGYRYNFHEDTDGITYGIASPVFNGSVNKNNGWKGDNVTLVSPSVQGVRRMDKDDIPDRDLRPIIEKLIFDAGSKWDDY